MRGATENGQGQEVDEITVQDVNDNIDKVVSKNLQRPKTIIEGKREIYDTPWGKKPVNGKIMAKVPYRYITLYLGEVIKNKFIVIGIAIDDDHR